MGCAIFGTQKFVHSPEGSSHGWVKIIFNMIIGSKLNLLYLPLSLLAIYFHLLPNRRWESNKIIYSWIVHYFLFTFESKWLCHLLFYLWIPLANLFGCATMFMKFFLHLLGNGCPLFGAMLLNESKDNLIFLDERSSTSIVHNLLWDIKMSLDKC